MYVCMYVCMDWYQLLCTENQWITLGLDVMQSHPLQRTGFGQYNSSSAALGWPRDGGHTSISCSIFKIYKKKLKSGELANWFTYLRSLLLFSPLPWTHPWSASTYHDCHIGSTWSICESTEYKSVFNNNILKINVKKIERRKKKQVSMYLCAFTVSIQDCVIYWVDQFRQIN